MGFCATPSFSLAAAGRALLLFWRIARRFCLEIAIVSKSGCLSRSDRCKDRFALSAIVNVFVGNPYAINPFFSKEFSPVC